MRTRQIKSITGSRGGRLRRKTAVAFLTVAVGALRAQNAVGSDLTHSDRMGPHDNRPSSAGRHHPALVYQSLLGLHLKLHHLMLIRMCHAAGHGSPNTHPLPAAHAPERGLECTEHWNLKRSGLIQFERTSPQEQASIQFDPKESLCEFLHEPAALLLSVSAQSGKAFSLSSSRRSGEPPRLEARYSFPFGNNAGLSARTNVEDLQDPWVFETWNGPGGPHDRLDFDQARTLIHAAGPLHLPQQSPVVKPTLAALPTILLPDELDVLRALGFHLAFPQFQRQ